MMNRLQRGFTLIELIVVMVVMGVLAGVLMVFFSPTLSNYFDTARRAALSDVADGAMRRITREVRVSVPNSIRTWGNQWVEFVPTSSGGRYRTAADINWDSTHPGDLSKPMEPGQSYTVFDTSTVAVAGENDWVVVGNQETNDVYQGVNRQQVDSVAAHAAGVPGQSRVTLKGDLTIPAGYDGARFMIVPGGQQAVSYVCQGGVGVDAAGNGKGTLERHQGYGFQMPTGTDKPVLSANPAILASHVSACTFHYDPNPGATQESGYLEVDLTITEANESVRLRFGVHVDNLP
jgi:MSHA biogenesis protein MshO